MKKNIKKIKLSIFLKKFVLLSAFITLTFSVKAFGDGFLEESYFENIATEVNNIQNDDYNVDMGEYSEYFEKDKIRRKYLEYLVYCLNICKLTLDNTFNDISFLRDQGLYLCNTGNTNFGKGDDEFDLRRRACNLKEILSIIIGICENLVKISSINYQQFTDHIKLYKEKYLDRIFEILNIGFEKKGNLSSEESSKLGAEFSRCVENLKCKIAIYLNTFKSNLEKLKEKDGITDLIKDYENKKFSEEFFLGIIDKKLKSFESSLKKYITKTEDIKKEISTYHAFEKDYNKFAGHFLKNIIQIKIEFDNIYRMVAYLDKFSNFRKYYDKLGEIRKIIDFIEERILKLNAFSQELSYNYFFNKRLIEFFENLIEKYNEMINYTNDLIAINDEKLLIERKKKEDWKTKLEIVKPNLFNKEIKNYGYEKKHYINYEAIRNFYNMHNK